MKVAMFYFNRKKWSKECFRNKNYWSSVYWGLHRPYVQGNRCTAQAVSLNPAFHTAQLSANEKLTVMFS